jgi:hypothetical protein
MRARLLGLTLMLALGALGAGGCKDLTYYDVDVHFDPATFSGQIGRVQACHMYVTGAETHDYDINDNTRNCPPPSTLGLDMGIFEYSSVADSGQLTFTMKVYNSAFETDNCLFGQGSTTVTLPAPLTTNPIMLNVVQMGAGCTP